MKELVVELSKFKSVSERRQERWDKFHAGTLLEGYFERPNPESEPYTIAFCYLPKLCLVVKGLHSEVRPFVDNLPACSYYMTFWKQGKHRGFWRLNAKAEERFRLSSHVDDLTGRRKYCLRKRPECAIVAEMRRIPRAYLKELSE